MPSQNASTASARPRAATSGSTCSHDQVEIARAVVRVLRRQRVRAEEAWCAPRCRVLLRRGARATSSILTSVVAIQAVARLDLDRGHALGAAAQASRARRRVRQLVLAGRAGRGHGADDAAAGARDLLVARPAAAARTRPRGRPRTRDGCGSRSGPASASRPRRRSPRAASCCGRSAAAPSQAIRPSLIASAPSSIAP